MASGSWERGEALISAAETKMREGDKAGAYVNLTEGLQHMMDSLVRAPPTLKQKRRTIIDAYMTSAEEIKSELGPSAVAAAPPRRNSNERQQPRPPVRQSSGRGRGGARRGRGRGRGRGGGGGAPSHRPAGGVGPRAKADQALYERIESEILDQAPGVTFEDVIGLDNVKQVLLESVILPAQRPDIFVGVRAPPKGLLLFGPPGNGKTFIAKALATECQATFFSISASSLTSRYVGDSEKLVRALFEVASARAPSVVFIDEIDSLLTARGGDNEQESSRRLKTEFLVRMDGVTSNDGGRVLLVGATNIPWELDDAVLRRFPKRILVPLPGKEARSFLIQSKLFNVPHRLSKRDIREISDRTEHFSASDISNLISDAAMGPVRELGMDVVNASSNDIPPVTISHFRDSLESVRPAVGMDAYRRYIGWNQEFGSSVKTKPKKKGGWFGGR